MDIGSKIKLLRTRKNLTREQFALELGEKPSKIQDIERGKQRVNDEFLGKMFSKFHVDLNWLFSNNIQSVSEIETDLVDEFRKKVSGRAEIEFALNVERELATQAIQASKDFWASHIPDSSEYTFVSLHDAELAAGTGALNLRERIVDQLAFRIDWLRRIGVTPASARLARVRGDSMAPTLQDRDLLLIDTSRIEIPIRPRKDGQPLRANLYALIEDGLARVKRIERSSADTLALHSDNVTLYPPEIRAGTEIGQLNIIGKVMWWGHTVRE